jgi:hypothetical protein
MRQALIAATASMCVAAGLLIADRARGAPLGTIMAAQSAATWLAGPVQYSYFDDDDDAGYVPYPPRRVYPPSIYDAPPRYYERRALPYAYSYSPREYDYTPPTYVEEPARPTSCGQYRYWNGEYCADARYERPYIGPKW